MKCMGNMQIDFDFFLIWELIVLIKKVLITLSSYNADLADKLKAECSQFNEYLKLIKTAINQKKNNLLTCTTM
jgi:hypothetical protein